ncbi:zinc finger protein STOP1 homolog [Beta vulgaris subsp. vulgaris]|uniref:zinc finger protein STOP1 homolog n=1 Tax=Beta vulgaris subsp. vulgaris TaxID=3555 RepID=UPI0025473537|nr:zinc finger protein STOP1 homolog [Beta vulgaris subsp. vulgaris]
MANSNNTLPLPPPEPPTTGDPLKNLSAIRHRVDSLSHILSNSVNGNTPLSRPESDTISSELTSAIHHIIINGAALLSSSSHTPKSDAQDFEIVELDVMELTADHSHTCHVCGKGFKRDANLRMHMRAHGEKFKTLESLSNPNNNHNNNNNVKVRFSCPYVGCNRNKKHKDFRPLKSVVCVKNHFRRSHCPKKYSCSRCKKKCFSMLSDLKNHMKHCNVEDENQWICSCGIKFLKKDDLFEHMGLFEGHMPIADNNNNDANFGLIEVEDYQGLPEMDLWSSIEDLVRF